MTLKKKKKKKKKKKNVTTWCHWICKKLLYPVSSCLNFFSVHFPRFLFLRFPDGFGNKLSPARQSLNKARLSHPLLPRMYIHESEKPTTLVVAVRGLSDWIHVGKASELKVRYLCCYFSFVVLVTDRKSSGSDECRCTLEVHHRAVHLSPHRCVGRPRLCFQTLVLICRTLL